MSSRALNGHRDGRGSLRIVHTGCPSGLSFSDVEADLNAHGLDSIAFCYSSDPPRDVARCSADLVVIAPHGDLRYDEIKVAAQVKMAHPEIPVIVLVEKGSEATAVTALRTGIDDYIALPTSAGEVTASIKRCLSGRQPSAPTQNGKSLAQAPERQHLVGVSLSMNTLHAMVERLAQTDATVLIRGETGTGKDLVALLLHKYSGRNRRPLIPINCGAIPDSLVESELFGYQRGAFTGADSGYEGKLCQANGGTVFLDEIGDMSLVAQAKLLRVIESKQVYRLGGKASMPLDVRILAATNQDLERMMAEGTFRKDLFYRLNVASIEMPPLRDRRADIPILVEHFLHLFNSQYGRIIQNVSSEAMEAFLGATWPGNVRELKSCVELAVLNCHGQEITAAHLPASLHPPTLDFAHADQEETRLLSVLSATKWNITAAAQELRWSRMTLYRKLTRYNLTKKHNKPE
jgi:DNA-binding NtrC family response regulator